MEAKAGEPEVPTIVVRGAPPWWQNWKWFATAAFCVFVVAVAFIAVLTYQAEKDAGKTLKKATEAVEIANAAISVQKNNAAILDRLDKSQGSLDELTNYLHSLPTQAGGESKSTHDFFTILCTNPVYADVCTQLGRP